MIKELQSKAFKIGIIKFNEDEYIKRCYELTKKTIDYDRFINNFMKNDYTKDLESKTKDIIIDYINIELLKNNKELIDIVSKTISEINTDSIKDYKLLFITHATLNSQYRDILLNETYINQDIQYIIDNIRYQIKIYESLSSSLSSALRNQYKKIYKTIEDSLLERLSIYDGYNHEDELEIDSKKILKTHVLEFTDDSDDDFQHLTEKTVLKNVYKINRREFSELILFIDILLFYRSTYSNEYLSKIIHTKSLYDKLEDFINTFNKYVDIRKSKDKSYEYEHMNIEMKKIENNNIFNICVSFRDSNKNTIENINNINIRDLFEYIKLKQLLENQSILTYINSFDELYNEYIKIKSKEELEHISSEFFNNFVNNNKIKKVRILNKKINIENVLEINKEQLNEIIDKAMKNISHSFVYFIDFREDSKAILREDFREDSKAILREDFREDSKAILREDVREDSKAILREDVREHIIQSILNELQYVFKVDSNFISKFANVLLNEDVLKNFYMHGYYGYDSSIIFANDIRDKLEDYINVSEAIKISNRLNEILKFNNYELLRKVYNRYAIEKFDMINEEISYFSIDESLEDIASEKSLSSSISSSLKVTLKNNCIVFDEEYFDILSKTTLFYLYTYSDIDTIRKIDIDNKRIVEFLLYVILKELFIDYFTNYYIKDTKLKGSCILKNNYENVSKIIIIFLLSLILVITIIVIYCINCKLFFKFHSKCFYK